MPLFHTSCDNSQGCSGFEHFFSDFIPLIAAYYVIRLRQIYANVVIKAATKNRVDVQRQPLFESIHVLHWLELLTFEQIDAPQKSYRLA